MSPILLLVTLLVGLIGNVASECANACSGHGKCTSYDMCICNRNWQANDCSERVCQFGLAHVDTPKGDLNMDGVISNANSRIVENSFNYPYGTSEQFPNMQNSNNQNSETLLTITWSAPTRVNATGRLVNASALMATTVLLASVLPVPTPAPATVFANLLVSLRRRTTATSTSCGTSFLPWAVSATLALVDLTAARKCASTASILFTLMTFPPSSTLFGASLL